MRHLNPLAIAAVLVVAAAAPHAREIIDRIAAVVAGDVIMLSDVRAAGDFGLVQVPEQDGPERDRAILSRLVDRALMLDEVDRYAPSDPSAAAIDEQLQRVRARFPTDDAFAQTLAHSGIDEAELRATLRDDLRLAAYLAERFQEPDEERRRTLIEEWVAGLRRRATIVMLL